MLNVLAGRSATAPGVDVTGKIEVDGVEIDPVVFRKQIAYVMQVIDITTHCHYPKCYIRMIH
jgi:hypothetical protein